MPYKNFIGWETTGAAGSHRVSADPARIDGVYRGPVGLVSGWFALIERSRDFTLLAWRPKTRADCRSTAAI
ncbi:DUF3363 domain-containing protein [Sphingobium sp. CECT 9361]|uniref:DUF3363 domain-containing protein n=1 Tax=Sphingobium sp. CECT 9361 TaxID=2845384 RepID=UPI001E588C9C|nr:DUF3363 domain-containing protein [Sphingobium sp. CECT 9361]